MSQFKFEIDSKTVEAFKEALRKKKAKTMTYGSQVIKDITILMEATISDKIARESTDTGRLLQSLESRYKDLHGEVITDAEHAPYVEYGAKPHRAPFLPIYEWVYRKRLDFGIKEKEVYMVAKSVWDKIAKYGTKPRQQWKRSIEEIEPIFNRRIKEAMTKALRE